MGVLPLSIDSPALRPIRPPAEDAVSGTPPVGVGSTVANGYRVPGRAASMQRAQKRTDPEAFVRALAPALRQSASIARALEGRVANRPKRGEATPVKAALTIADTASQEALLVPLLEGFPKVRLAAEEDTPSTLQFPDDGPELVVIDPIDGTLRFYLEGMGPYAVMIGLARERVFEAALVALPREDLYFDA